MIAIAEKNQRIEYVWNPLFDEPDAESRIAAMGPEAVRKRDDSESERRRSHLARLCREKLLAPDEERWLFCRMNFLKHRANEHILQHGVGAAGGESRAEKLLAEAMRIRNRIVEANLRLVISIARQIADHPDSVDELVSASLAPLIRAVEVFDFARGFRFSTYANHTIVHAQLRQRKRRARRRQSQRPLDAGMAASLEDHRLDVGHRRSQVEAARATAADLVCHLPKREQQLLSARFGLGKHNRAHTFLEIGDMFALSKERVRVLTHRAVDRLREIAEREQLDWDG